MFKSAERSIMSEASRIIQAVAELWHDGPVLFGADWPQVRQQLLLNLEHLDTHPNEEAATLDALLALFDAYPEARDRLVTELGTMPALEKGDYKPLLDGQGQIGASRFTCPDPGCGFTWTRRVVGQRVEKCPVHHLPLALVTE
jgi:hypothetical protein